MQIQTLKSKGSSDHLHSDQGIIMKDFTEVHLNQINC